MSCQIFKKSFWTGFLVKKYEDFLQSDLDQNLKYGKITIFSVSHKDYFLSKHAHFNFIWRNEGRVETPLYSQAPRPMPKAKLQVFFSSKSYIILLYHIGSLHFLEGPFWGGSRVTLTIFQFWFRVMLCMGFWQIRLDRLRHRVQDDLA